MTLPGGPANVDTTKGLFLTSAYGNGNQSIADLTGNDEDYVKAVYKDRFIGGGGSVWSNPGGPLGLLFQGVGGGLFDLIKKPFAQLVTILVSVLDLIPIIGPPAGDALEYLASIFGVMSTKTDTAQETGEVAQVTADSALAGVALVQAKVDTAPTGITILDTFDRPAAPTLGDEYTQLYSVATAGTGSLGTDGNNDAAWTAQGGQGKDVIARHDKLLNTNRQSAQIVVAADIPNYSTGDHHQEHIWLRVHNTAASFSGITGIKGLITRGQCEIGYVITGTYTRLGAAVTGLGSVAGRWELLAGDGDDYEFVLLQDGNERCRRLDSAHNSQMGAGYRKAALGQHAGIDIAGFIYSQGAPPNIQAFTAIDRIAA